jgi:hypothetical protein
VTEGGTTIPVAVAAELPTEGVGVARDEMSCETGGRPAEPVPKERAEEPVAWIWADANVAPNERSTRGTMDERRILMVTV